MKKISFVIPCYRSEKTIGSVITEIRETMDEYMRDKSMTYEIILINDCSPDNTFEVIEHICEQYDNITGINLARNCTP